MASRLPFDYCLAASLRFIIVIAASAAVCGPFNMTLPFGVGARSVSGPVIQPESGRSNVRGGDLASFRLAANARGAPIYRDPVAAAWSVAAIRRHSGTPQRGAVGRFCRFRRLGARKGWGSTCPIFG